MPKWGSGVLIPWAGGEMLILWAGRGWSRNVPPPRIIGTDALDRSCFVFWDLEGEREKGRMEVHVESTARRWQWGTCRSSGPFPPFPYHQGPFPPHQTCPG